MRDDRQLQWLAYALLLGALMWLGIIYGCVQIIHR